MTLTEQWNKGKLPEGDYYIKRRNGYLPYDNIDSRGVWRNSIDEDIVEVLAPVPSYEEWQQLHKFLEEFNALDVAKENKKLKELLKECKRVLNKAKGDTVWYPVEIDHTLTQIDEVLK